jgi:hypothetical protein
VTITAASVGPIGSSGALSGLSNVSGHGHDDAASATTTNATSWRRVVQRRLVSRPSDIASTSRAGAEGRR